MKSHITYSYSLFAERGEIEQRYAAGMLANIIEVREFWPTANIDIFCDAVAIEWLQRFLHIPSFVELHLRGKGNPYLWRYQCKRGDFVCVRDVDSRITRREFLAVTDWINSGRAFHIIRDHKQHQAKILAGMFGYKPTSFVHFQPTLNTNGGRHDDERILASKVYPNVLADTLVHTSATETKPNELTIFMRPASNFIGRIVNF